MSYNPFYTREELESMGFKSLGENVYIDRRTPIDKPYKISIGNNVRIGSFCILAGDITIGNYVHIASFTSLFAGVRIVVKDFVGISNYVKIITESDDFSGFSSSCAMLPEKYRNITRKEIIIERHCVIGSSSTLLPGAYMDEYSVLGAMSLLQRKTKQFGIYFGIPAKKILDRSRDIMSIEREFLLNKDIL